ncbi:AsmA family protein [Escherichia coli]|uniref:AsmA family protein n=1 Tax=Escherichia coli TaxID=562 RepID=A0A2X1NBL8_ECOLX|nr:AsmA family protein [Escherichia coli]
MMFLPPNVLIEGSIDNDRVTLTNLGADIARGTLTGNAQRNADGSWQVENLRMADIRLQSEKSLTDFFAPLRSVPSLQIGSPGSDRCSFARSGLGGDRPRSQLAQHDLQ